MVTDLIDIDEMLRRMWDEYAIQPQYAIVDGIFYERLANPIVVHWDRSGWRMGPARRKP